MREDEMKDLLNKFNFLGIISAMLVLTMLFGNNTIMDIRILGIVPTFYRVLIPTLFVIMAWYNFKQDVRIVLTKEAEYKAVKLFFLVMVIWIVYGTVGMFVSPWSVFSEAAKELLALGLGLLSMYAIVSLCRYGQLDVLVEVLKLAVLVSVALGIFEVFSAWHLPTSMYEDPAYWEVVKEYIPLKERDNPRFYSATGFFYNPNDYCTFNAIFAPLFLGFKPDTKLGKKILNYVAFSSVILMLFVNDAFICFVAMLIGVVFFLLITKASIKKWGIVAFLIAFLRYWGNGLLRLFFHFLTLFIRGEELRLAIRKQTEEQVKVSALEDALGNQLANMQQETGSLFLRLNTYTESLMATISPGMGLGLGPGSFTAYFGESVIEKKMMANPHALWIEILVQYGVIIFLLFVGVLLYLFVKLFQKYLQTRDMRIAMILSIGVCFIFGCCAPSRYLGTTYYWLIFGLALGLLVTDYNNEGINENEPDNK